MPLTPPVLDPWTPFNFKAVMGPGAQPKVGVVPDYIGMAHRRRLTAYMIAQAFIDNDGQAFMGTTSTVDSSRREYGDPGLLRDQIVTAILGDDPQIVTEGAQDPISLVKSLEGLRKGKDRNPAIDPTTSMPIPGTEEAPPELDAEAKAKIKATEDAQAFQAWMRKTADKERFGAKLDEETRNSVGLGDGVYTLGYNGRSKRMRLRVFDPGFYFPVLTDDDDDDFPRKIHFMWEVDSDPFDGRNLPAPADEKRIRRITYELVDLPTPVRRRYNDPGETVTETCLQSDATFVVKAYDPQRDDFALDKAIWALTTDPVTGEEVPFREVDLQLDFIPVVHIPNTNPGSHHFGQSSIGRVLQIAEDISLNDTDLQASSATTGKPPVALVGGRLGAVKPSYKAGEVWEVDVNGKLEMMDTSRSLDALLKHSEALLSRFSVNSRVPAVALGRQKIERDIAGISLKITYGPMISMVREGRRVRSEKFDMLFKFWWRASKQYKVPDTPETYVPTHLQFGSFLPTDQESIVGMVKNLMETNAISLETATLMLLEAGLPIEDVAEEVLRIQSRDFKGANLLLDATGDQPGVYDYLGRKMPNFIHPNPGGGPTYNPGDPTVSDPGGADGVASSRGVQAQGQGNPNGAVTGPSAPGAAPQQQPGQAGPPPGPRPQGAVWIEGYYQTRGNGN